MAETLASKITKATMEIGGRLKADKKNTQQNYFYISADKILAEAGQALAEQGIAIIPKITAAEVTLIQYAPDKTRWDARLTIVEVVTDGTETLEIPWAGWGSDYSVPDKAAYKAITSGDKYFRMKLLSIGEGNEDGEHETEPERKPAQAQRPAPVNGKPAAEQVEPEHEDAPPAVQPANGNKPTQALLDRWSKLVQEAQGIGIKVAPIVPGKITADELIERGKDLRDQIETAKATAAA